MRLSVRTVDGRSRRSYSIVHRPVERKCPGATPVMRPTPSVGEIGAV
jgi:hypothetical protein